MEIRVALWSLPFSVGPKISKAHAAPLGLFGLDPQLSKLSEKKKKSTHKVIVILAKIVGALL